MTTKTPLSLFLDDERLPPSDGRKWVIARDYKQFCSIVQDLWGKLDVISFDHDLGPGKTGYDAVCFIERILGGIPNSRMPCQEFRVHSMNPVGASRIRQVIEAIQRAQEPPFSKYTKD